MYPTLIKFGSFEITTFGLMMFLAFVVAGWVLSRQFRHYGLSDDAAGSSAARAAPPQALNAASTAGARKWNLDVILPLCRARGGKL